MYNILKKKKSLEIATNVFKTHSKNCIMYSDAKRN
jgi:hypothetical protein